MLCAPRCFTVLLGFGDFAGLYGLRDFFSTLLEYLGR